jgi:hypothetical protein
MIIRQKRIVREQFVEIFCYPGFKGFIPFSFKSKCQPDPVARFFSLLVRQSGFSQRRLQSHTQRRIAWKLVPVLSPILDQSNVRRTLPANHAFRDFAAEY